ncbi:MAG: hypothetical protein M3077_05820 [Candidatus Dormibacteraeota bacterium]|nr:hypothetical protein [Candidatus Dormibacteraeota bacterium]
MEDNRPDPLGALRAAAAECGLTLPDGLLESVLQIESDAPETAAARTMVQASLRALIEANSKDAS